MQLLESSGLDSKSKEFNNAYEGRCKAWDSYFDELTLPEKTEPLKSRFTKFVEFFKSEELEKTKFDDPYFNTPLVDKLYTPTHQVTELCLYLYTIDSWLVYELN